MFLSSATAVAWAAEDARGRSLVQNEQPSGYDEPLRPQFHFTAKKNWLNDPNGLVSYDGEYHLFLQHNPEKPDWGPMHWGHAVSTDLVHWKELPIALYPDELGTCWSGSGIVDRANTSGLKSGDEDPILLFYTAAAGEKPASQCLAYSNDRGRTFTKYSANPILPHIVATNRDPKVIWHEPTKRWVMALFKDGNTYALFSSTDLKSWTHLHDLEFPGCGECPDLFELPVDDNPKHRKWVFVGGDGSYLLGSFDGKEFNRESGPHRADYGTNYYATQTFSNIPERDGRRIQMAWMRGGTYPGMPFNQQMNFPTELSLRTFPAGIRLCRVPVREIASLYGKEQSWKNETVTPGTNLLEGLKGELYDIQAEFDLGDVEELRLELRGQAISYRPAGGKLTCVGQTCDLKPIDGRLKLRALVDRTSLEVYADDGRAVFSFCFLPAAGEPRYELSAHGGSVKVVSFRAVELKSSWR